MSLSDALLNDLSLLFKKETRIWVVYLFGSRAREDFTETSDYDFAFLTAETLSLDEQVDLNVSIMKILKSDQVDFVFLEKAPIILKYEVLSEGKIIYKKSDVSDEQLNSIELSVYREYFHTEKYRKLQREALKETFFK